MDTRRDLNDYSWMILHEDPKPKEDNSTTPPPGGG